jgi:hypothetical protein
LVRRFSGACVRERLFSKYLPYSFSWIIVEELLNAACLFGIWLFSDEFCYLCSCRLWFPSCRGGDRGSIPRRGVSSLFKKRRISFQNFC